MQRLGIDIGGTKIIFALVKGAKIIKSWKVFTPKDKKELIGVLKENIPQGVEKIGIGVPGPLDKKGDLILNPPNLRALRNCPLANIIKKETGIETAMEKDANCFTLGEAVLGAGRGRKLVFGITLGTGVGGGIVVDGRICRGGFGSAGEVGHMTIKFDGPNCTCGGFGCLEEYCSERFFKNKGFLPKSLKAMADNGDKKAREVFKEYGRYLGTGLANVINLLDPEVIVVGGGIANACRFFIKEAQKEANRRIISPVSQKNVKIKKAAFGEFGGAIGAALLK